MVEHAIENRSVGGSIPPPATTSLFFITLFFIKFSRFLETSSEAVFLRSLDPGFLSGSQIGSQIFSISMGTPGEELALGTPEPQNLRE